MSNYNSTKIDEECRPLINNPVILKRIIFIGIYVIISLIELAFEKDHRASEAMLTLYWSNYTFDQLSEYRLTKKTKNFINGCAGILISLLAFTLCLMIICGK